MIAIDFPEVFNIAHDPLTEGDFSFVTEGVSRSTGKFQRLKWTWCDYYRDYVSCGRWYTI